MARRPKTSELLDREPPHDTECEMSLLGSLLLDSKYMPRLRSFLEEEDFYREANATLWKHMQLLNTACHDVTLLTARLREAGDLKRVGGREYLAKLVQSVAVAAHAEYYARIVKGHAVRRRLIGVALEIVQDCYGGEGSTPELVEAAYAKLEGIRSATNAAKKAIKTPAPAGPN